MSAKNQQLMSLEQQWKRKEQKHETVFVLLASQMKQYNDPNCAKLTDHGQSSREMIILSVASKLFPDFLSTADGTDVCNKSIIFTKSHEYRAYNKTWLREGTLHAKLLQNEWNFMHNLSSQQTVTSAAVSIKIQRVNKTRCFSAGNIHHDTSVALNRFGPCHGKKLSDWPLCYADTSWTSRNCIAHRPVNVYQGLKRLSVLHIGLWTFIKDLWNSLRTTRNSRSATDWSMFVTSVFKNSKRLKMILYVMLK